MPFKQFPPHELTDLFSGEDIKSTTYSVTQFIVETKAGHKFVWDEPFAKEAEDAVNQLMMEQIIMNTVKWENMPAGYGKNRL